MLPEISAQVVFNFPRYNNNGLTDEETENSREQRGGNNQPCIFGNGAIIKSFLQTVNGVSDNNGDIDRARVGKEDKKYSPPEFCLIPYKIFLSDNKFFI